MESVDAQQPPGWRLRLRPAVQLAAFLLAALLPAAGQAAIDDALRAVKKDEPARFVAQAGNGASVNLELRTLQPFGRDAQLVLVAADGSHRGMTDATRYYAVQGRDDASLRGILTLRADGRVRGLLRGDGGFAWLETGKDDRLHLVPVEPAKSESAPFQCGNSDVPEGALQSAEPSLRPDAAATAAPPDGYRARIAIETDTDFLALFGGNVEDATAYVGSLMGFISTVYEAEVDTRMEVSYLRLWETPDPFVQTTTGCALIETGKYWNDNQTAVGRSTMHFMSGRASPRAGVAWLGVMCGAPFSMSPASLGYSCPGLDPNTVSNYGGAYGVSMGLTGGFDAGNPAAVWDVVAVAHEIGHNFNSPHTHCYNGLGGNPDPVDTCYSGESGCFAGSTALPGAGAGSGTLMSYCHLKPGGLANLSLTLGAGHPFGVQPERIPSRMLAHVESRAAANAACLIEPVAQAPLSATATPDTLAVGATSTLGASGGSGTGAVSFAVSAGAEHCSIDAATLTALAPGACEVTATKAGDANYLPANASLALTVLAPQAPLAIVTVPDGLVFGDTAQVEVTGGSGTGAVTLTVSAGDTVCTLDGNTLTAMGIGACELSAGKAADAQYAAASATLSLDVGRAAQLPLTLAATPPNLAQGDNSVLSVGGGSGDGPLALELSAGAALCTLDGFVLTAAANGTGTCTVTANKAGGGVHLPASASVDVGVFAPAVDLELDLVRTDPPPGSSAPGARSYRVSVTNHGPVGAPGVQLDIGAPTGLSEVLWTCDAEQACEPEAGNGIVGTRFDLAIGGSAQVELSGEPHAGRNYVVIDASVLPGTAMTSLTPADDSRRLVDGLGDRLFGDGYE